MGSALMASVSIRRPLAIFKARRESAVIVTFRDRGSQTGGDLYVIIWGVVRYDGYNYIYMQPSRLHVDRH